MKTRILLACACLFTTSAQASLVTVHGYASYATFSDPQGLLPFTEVSANYGFQFDVTYDDTATTDRAPADPRVGAYASAIQSMNVWAGFVALQPGALRYILVLDDSSTSDPDTVTDAWIASATDGRIALDDAGNTRQVLLSLGLLNFGSKPVLPFASDALAAPPQWSTPFGFGLFGARWSAAELRYSIEDFDAQGVSLGVRANMIANVTDYFVHVTEVPLPAAGWLLGTGLLAVVSRSRRRA